MNAFIRRACARRGFSVVEVLVTIAIITILMALFVPALNKVGEVAARVKQKAQFTNIELGLEAYKNDYGDYPISFSYDGLAFCDGAQTLGEAIVGLDGLGLHPDSIFSPGRLDAAGVEIYYPGIAGTPQETASVQSRTGPYLENDAANAIRLGDIYDNSPASLAGTMVLADMFTKKMRTGIKAGMPILYYRANTANSGHDPGTTPAILNNNIYKFDNNTAILGYGTPWSSVVGPHVMDGTNRQLFYRNTQDPRFTVVAQPYRSQSFILLSAGKDGLYGTADDVYNFDRVEQ